MVCEPVCLSAFLSVCLSLFLSLSVPQSLTVFLCLSVSLSFSLCLSLSPCSVSLYLCPFLSLSTCVPFCLSLPVSLSVSLYLCPFLSLSTCVPFCLSLPVSFYTSPHSESPNRFPTAETYPLNYPSHLINKMVTRHAKGLVRNILRTELSWNLPR